MIIDQVNDAGAFYQLCPLVQLPRKGLKGSGRRDKRRVVDETKKAIMTQHLVPPPPPPWH